MDNNRDFHAMIGLADYKAFAGPDWPNYDALLQGDLGPDLGIQQEVLQFIGMMKETYHAQVKHGDVLAEANQLRQRHIFFDKQYLGQRCQIPWQTLGINANGDVFICLSPSWVPKFVGNILESEDIFNILNSPMARAIRTEITQGRYSFCNNALCAFFSAVDPRTYNFQGPEYDPAMPAISVDNTINRIPKDIILDFDYTCNFRCPSCRTEVVNNNKHHVIRPINDRIVERIQQLVIDRITDESVTIRWCGGEPFISESYLALLQYITDHKSLQCKHVIQTNGSYLKKKSDLVLSLLPMIKEMRVSFDAATADTYHKVRMGGRWDQLITNVCWLRKQIDQHASNCLLSADFVVQLDNYLEIPRFVNLCQDLGIKHINWQKMWNWGTWSQEEFDHKNIYNPTHPLYNDLAEQFRKISYSMSLV